MFFHRTTASFHFVTKAKRKSNGKLSPSDACFKTLHKRNRETSTGQNYYPNKQKVRRGNRFETPSGIADSHGNIIGHKMPSVSMINDDKELSSTYEKEKLPKSFEEMQIHGLKIT